MISDISTILKRLEIEATGRYDNHFYVIELDNSDHYARMYTKLSKKAINTEFPNFEVNTNNTTTKITNYFELEEGNISYNIFLIANFDKDKYYIKIGER